MEINFVTASSNLSVARQAARREASEARDPQKAQIAPRRVVRANQLELTEEENERWGGEGGGLGD